MATNVFMPSSAHVATVPITVSPSGLACSAELWLSATPGGSGTKLASVTKTFTSTGAAQNITFNVTMPSTSGVIYIFIDLYVGGQLLLGYNVVDTITVPSGSVGPPVWS